MSATVKNPIQAGSSPTPDSLRQTPDSERSGSPSKVALSAKEQQALDELAMLFTIQEERCLAQREASKLSKDSLTSSQLADASFIYQHVNFKVLSKCVPGFVKTHLNKNGRYLPETFILRVNYWRRRRALGEDSTAKRAAKESVGRKCSSEQGNPSPRAISSRSPRAQTVASKQASSSEARVTMISG